MNYPVDRWFWKVRIAMAMVLCSQVGLCCGAGLLGVDYQKLVSRADLRSSNATARSEDGLPIGNGRMGSLVWTTPSALHLQVNRVDVFANDSATESFPERHTDYCGGCGFLDIELDGSSAEVFPREGTTQHLSCYEALAVVRGSQVKARVLAWHERDVMAIEITDNRPQPGAILLNLRPLRPPVVRTGKHTAESKLEGFGDALVLTQRFTEGEYFCGSAVAVRVLGRRVEVKNQEESGSCLRVEPGAGVFTVLVASAASLRRADDIKALVLAQLDAAAPLGFGGLLEANRAWWHDYWSKSFVHLYSDDRVADRLERDYTYFLYVMASSSRGKFPPKFNGMLWTTGGDRRQWGSQFWGANQSCLYNNALLAANHAELLDPMFNMYSAMAKSCELAARQQWGSRGIFIPETVAFDGLAPLPEDIAAEMRDLYLAKKPWETVSDRFREFARGKQPHSSRWNWIQSGRWLDGRWVYQERGAGPYGPVTHIFSRGAKIAYQYWLRYDYLRDEAWLRDHAYPMLRGVAEFYRNYPNLRKGEDGRYHIHHVNSNEPLWGGQDTDEEISGMRGVLPVAILAGRILKLDPELQISWRELLEHLAPLPRSDHPNAVTSTNALFAAGRRDPPVWVKGLTPVVLQRGGSLPDGNTMPMWFFDLCTLESDAETLRTANATFDAFFPKGVTSSARPGVLSKLPLVAAILGRSEAVRHLVPNQMAAPGVSLLENRMDLREGPQTASVQRLGNAADALHTALCQDFPSGPGEPPTLRVFAAWPKEWDAEFKLLCRGRVLVTSAMRNGEVEFVELEPEIGGECRLRNPWAGTDVTLYRQGRKAETLGGSLLIFPTRRGETVVLVRADTTPDQFRRTLSL